VIYLLDTNAWIAFLRQNNARLVQRFLQVVPTDILLNSKEFSRVPDLKLEDWS
jgi:predicted nucleic acid-binding protein